MIARVLAAAVTLACVAATAPPAALADAALPVVEVVSFESSTVVISDDGAVIPLDLPANPDNTRVSVPDSPDAVDTTGSADQLLADAENVSVPFVDYNLTRPPNVAGVSSQSNSGQYGHQFGPNNTYYHASDSNGNFSGQITYKSGNPIAWAFRLSPYLQSIATSPVNAKAALFRDGQPTSYSYKKVQDRTYLYHSTILGSNRNHRYQLGGNYNFRVNVGGKTGTANVRMVFNYVVTYT